MSESGCNDYNGLKDKNNPYILPKSFNPDSNPCQNQDSQDFKIIRIFSLFI